MIKSRVKIPKRRKKYGQIEHIGHRFTAVDRKIRCEQQRRCSEYMAEPL